MSKQILLENYDESQWQCTFSSSQNHFILEIDAVRSPRILNLRPELGEFLMFSAPQSVRLRLESAKSPARRILEWYLNRIFEAFEELEYVFTNILKIGLKGLYNNIIFWPPFKSGCKFFSKRENKKIQSNVHVFCFSLAIPLILNNCFVLYVSTIHPKNTNF